MGDVIFLRRREPADASHEADPSTARSIDELPPIAPWRRRQFDVQLRRIIGVESAVETRDVARARAVLKGHHTGRSVALQTQPKARPDAEVAFELRRVEDWAEQG